MLYSPYPKDFKFPSIAERQSQIEEFKKINLYNIPIETLIEQLRHIKNGHMIAALVFPPGINFFRAIKYNEKPK